jgi:hypothetical protein
MAHDGTLPKAAKLWQRTSQAGNRYTVGRFGGACGRGLERIGRRFITV